jgi:hypothetical protein
MQLPGLLVEYLINGVISLLWVMPTGIILGVEVNKFDTTTALILLPALYLMGMLIDFLGSRTLSWYKRRIMQEIQEEIKKTTGVKQEYDEHYIEAKLKLYSPELAHAVEMRSSRDRIARGSAINFLLATIVWTTFLARQGRLDIAIACAIVGIILIAIDINMWARFQSSSYSFSAVSLITLEEKLKREEKSKRSSEK